MNHSITKRTTSNGISVVLVPLENTAVVTAIVLMGVGSRHESDSQRGLAHFTEHMVFKGGRKFLTAQQIAQSLDAVGGEFNAFTSQEFTGFYTKTAAHHLSLGLDVLSDMTLHASFPEEELEKEKGVIVEEMNMYEDMPMRKVDQILSELVYGDSPLGRPIIGTKESVTAFTRDDFTHYREQFYKGSQCTVVIAGSVDVEEAMRLVEDYFGDMPKGEPYRPVPATFMERESRVLLEQKASEQTHLMLAVKGYEISHPLRYPYRVLATILGGNMSSRLFVSVREEQGLCYYVRSMPDSYVDAGLLVASAGVDNARLPLAVTAILNEFRKLRDEPVSEEELERAKQFLFGKMLLSMEDSEQVAEFYGMQQLLEGEIETVESIEAKVAAVTSEDIQRIAKELFVSEELRLAVIGPHADAKALEELLVL
ncbi:MAG: processing protease [Patescibacteria group bacterium]|nr:processing protease [Patescibacteria group bacterium]